MPQHRVSLRHLTLAMLLLAALLAQAIFAPVAQAQDTPAIMLSLPGSYSNIITADTLAAFEAQYNVRVYIEYGDQNMTMGFGGQPSIDSQLEEAEALASSADVIYVDQATLTPTATQAGYFLNLAPLANSDPALQVNDFYPAVWQSFQWDQGIWALPTATDVIIVTYDPATFDAAGLAYPNERWTIDDFANAARALTTYNDDGTVATAGLQASTPASTLPYLVRALAGTGFYDDTVFPNTPSFSNPALEYILDVWAQLAAEGTATSSFVRFGGGEVSVTSSPLRIEGTFGFAGRFAADDDSAATRQAVLLPGGTAGLSAEGFAVSSGTRYPELSYALAAYLTTLPDLASANFLAAAPARQSLAGVVATTNGGGQGPGQAGNAGGRLGAANIPDQIQAVIDQALYLAFAGSEVRYGSYLNTIVTQINSSGLDARTALTDVEASAIRDAQTAAALNGTTTVVVATPPEEVALAPGQIALNCAINTGFGFGPNAQLANEDTWQQVIDTFVASDPDIGAVNLEPVNQSDLATLAADYDCFILPTNAVQGSDVSPVLNLDPLLSTDPTFSLNDILPGVIPQLQQNNLTWALPLALSPQMLRYDPDLLAQAGVPEPVNGWTTASFIDALRQLVYIMDDDSAPFQPNDPSGSYIMQLIGAFGGLPIDYRTDPPTLSFTDPNTLSAIQQVLDLAVQGYMDYNSLAVTGIGGIRISFDTNIPITTDVLSGLIRGAGRGPQALARNNGVQTLYPQSTQGAGFVAFDITTGYISAMAQNPEAAYRFLSAAAQQPALFSGMPVRRSLINDPSVLATQGEDVVAIYSQLEALLQNPNTLIFPANSGLGGIVTNAITEYWLKAAFDAYVLEGADLLTELQDAELLTAAYLECTATLEPVAEDDIGMGGFQQMIDCATTVDSSLSFGQ